MRSKVKTLDKSLKIILTLLLTTLIIFPTLTTINFAASESTPSITLTPNSGPKGTIVKVTGQDFPNASDITLIFASQIIEQVQIAINQTGFTTNIVIPDVPTGSYTLTAENINITTVSATFQVTPQPTVTFTPDSAVPGTPITITGSGFPKSTTTETYNIQLRGNYGTLTYFVAGVTQTDAQGNFEYTTQALDYMGNLFAIAYRPPEGNPYISYTLMAPCPTFTVIPSLTLTPSTGPTGTNVTAVGRGFSSVSTNRLMWTTQQLNVYDTSGATQDYIQLGMHQLSFTAIFTVPNTSPGTYTIQAQQTIENDPHTILEGGKTASATFTVTAAPTPEPTPTPTPTETPTPEPTPTPTTTPEPTATPIETPTPTPTPTETPTPEPTPTPTTTPTITPEPTATPIETPTPTPEFTPTLTPSTTQEDQMNNTQTAEPSPTATPQSDQPSTTLYILAAAIAIGTIGTTAFLLTRRQKENNTPTNIA